MMMSVKKLFDMYYDEQNYHYSLTIDDVVYYIIEFWDIDSEGKYTLKCDPDIKRAATGSFYPMVLRYEPDEIVNPDQSMSN